MTHTAVERDECDFHKTINRY